MDDPVDGLLADQIGLRSSSLLDKDHDEFNRILPDSIRGLTEKQSTLLARANEILDHSQVSVSSRSAIRSRGAKAAICASISQSMRPKPSPLHYPLRPRGDHGGGVINRNPAQLATPTVTAAITPPAGTTTAPQRRLNRRVSGHQRRHQHTR